MIESLARNTNVSYYEQGTQCATERLWPLKASVGVKDSAGPTGTCGAALECAALILAEPTPDACILAGFQCPLQAGLDYFTAATDSLGLFDLEQSGTGVSDREEQFWVLIEACCTMSPIHGDLSTN
ncbi:hypothetical protein GCM10009813_09120 [Brevibacterium marinum]